MGKINQLKSANITVLEPSEERRKEILDIIGSMMMDYINQGSKNDDKK
ncbi:hypothetical protein ACDN41_11600 [Priestia aryabhattai]